MEGLGKRKQRLFLEGEIEGEPETLEHEEVLWVTAAGMGGLELAPADAAFAGAF